MLDAVRGDVMIQARVRRLLRRAHRDAGEIDELLRTVLQSRIAVQFIPANSQVCIVCVVVV
jgi:hypothetical protein